MTEITAETMAGPRKPLLKRLAPVLVPVLALGAGAGSTLAGLWSPMALLGPAETAAEARAAPRSRSSTCRGSSCRCPGRAGARLSSPP